MTASADGLPGDLPVIEIEVNEFGPRARTLPCPVCHERVTRIEGFGQADVVDHADTTRVTVYEPLCLLPCGHQAGSITVRHTP